MSKQWQPKKIREFSYPENASKMVDEWFINYASLQKISKETGIARTTLYRWKREMVKNNQSLQEFISVVNYKKCVDLEISDWKEFTKKKEEAKKIDSALSKQARDLRAQLAAQGFEVTIRTSKSQKEAKKQAHFKQILILQSDSDPKKVSQGRALFNKLSDKDKQAYLEYRKKHAND